MKGNTHDARLLKGVDDNVLLRGTPLMGHHESILMPFFFNDLAPEAREVITPFVVELTVWGENVMENDVKVGLADYTITLMSGFKEDVSVSLLIIKLTAY
jgi:hypothetical protein